MWFSTDTVAEKNVLQRLNGTLSRVLRTKLLNLAPTDLGITGQRWLAYAAASSYLTYSYCRSVSNAGLPEENPRLSRASYCPAREHSLLGLDTTQKIPNHGRLKLASRRRTVEFFYQGPGLHLPQARSPYYLNTVGHPLEETVNVGDNQDVPLFHHVMNFQQTVPFVLRNAEPLGQSMAHGTTDPDQRLHLQIEFPVPRLPHRDPTVTANRYFASLACGWNT